jgi:tetratricopeptide (TPR) repeat protein
LLKRAVALIEDNHDLPPYRVGVALDSLATLYRAENKISLAEDLWQRELQIDRKLFGEYHPQTAMVLGHLAEAWSAEGDFDKARDYGREATVILSNHFGAGSSAAASGLVNQAVIEERANRLDDSARLFSQALEILRESADPQEHSAGIVAQLYAGLLNRMHKGREAKQITAEAAAFHAK